ncbi:MAG TPA: transcriptional regulator [Thermoanaerobaculia bacterium]|jgi:DNA-binding MarR family transcriptional regulator
MSSRQPFEKLAGLDRLVHEPARMSILTALAACRSADFLFLQRLTGLSKGNLSSHLSKLEEGALVAIAKTFEGKIPRTNVTITPEGRKQIEHHWKNLDRLRKQASGWKPEKENDE